MLLYLYSADLSIASAAAAASSAEQSHTISKADKLKNNLIECFRRSNNTPIHSVVKEVAFKLSIVLSDLQSQEECQAFATQMYQLISTKYEDQFEIVYKDQDHAFALEELLAGCLNRRFLVQVASKTHRLHGFPMTPLDNFLHDLLHIYAAKVYPMSTRIMKNLYEDMKHQSEMNSVLHKKFITAIFLIMHEMVSTEKSEIDKSRKEPYFENLLDFLQDYKMFVVGYFSYFVPKNFIFTTDEEGDMLSNEAVLQQIVFEDEIEIVDKNALCFRVRIKKEQELSGFTFNYFLNDARDILWRLKQCNMTSGIDSFEEIQKADRETQVHWVKMIHARQVKVLEDVFDFLQERYTKPIHPMAQWFKLLMQEEKLMRRIISLWPEFEKAKEAKAAKAAAALQGISIELELQKSFQETHDALLQAVMDLHENSKTLYKGHLPI